MKRALLPISADPGLDRALCRACLACAILLLPALAPAQEALRASIAGQAATEARRQQVASRDYTFKSGDFRLLVLPSLGLDYNDNINTSKENQLDDFILRPSLRLTATYPITQRNLLTLDIGAGYDKYFDHDEYSTWRLFSGSQVAFDIAVKDFLINIHDRFQFTQDSAREAAVANTATYGNLENTVGVGVSWDLNDLILGAGYDHQNIISQSDNFEYQDHASELFYTRATFILNPQLDAGVEATASITSYDQPILNDNAGYSAGVFADWHPGKAFHITPRGGYTLYDFDQTSVVILAEDLNTWYLDLTLRHDITETVSYSISAGHQIRLGVQSDLIDEYYVRPSVYWKIIKNLTLTTFFSYEHGDQDNVTLAGSISETYDWFSAGASLTWPLLKRLSASLNYRITYRDSDLPNREYTQNLVGLLLTYRLQ